MAVDITPGPTLSWSNFRRVRARRGADAQTGGRVSLSSGSGGHVVRLTLARNDTWVVRGRETAGLLRHEQGHWDILILWAYEADRELQGLTGAAVRAKFNEVGSKYRRISAQYDSETNHSQQQNKQEEWDCKLASALRNYQLDLAVVCPPQADARVAD